MNRSLTTLLFAFALAGCNGPGVVAVDSARAAITNADDDADSPEANVVVNLSKNGVECTGTLITPQIVLTANHCITGGVDAKPIGPNVVKPGMGFQPDVRLGLRRANLDLPENKLTSTQTLVLRNEPIQPFQGGVDAALVFLSAPVLTKAKIVRPSLVSDRPCCQDDDDDGGTYIGPLGLAGWSPLGVDDEVVPRALASRQAAIFNSIDLDHYPESPGGDFPGQTWQHREHGIDLRGGDSGGPLFKVRQDAACGDRGDCGTRDIWGVANGTVWSLWGSYDRWTDVTRGIPRDFILANVVDHAHDAQPRWIAKHPATWPGTVVFNGVRVEKWLPRTDNTPRWIGERDYTGACQIAFDRDCDHWYDEHDNCPAVANDDQADRNDDNVGDACPPAPREIFQWARMHVDPNHGNQFPPALFAAGWEAAEGTQYACRAQLNGGLHLGNEHLGGCRIGWGGGQSEIYDFEILTYQAESGDLFVPGWTAAANGAVPANALVGGNEADGRPLVVCRTHYYNPATYTTGTFPGKLVGDGCNIAVAGTEQHVTDYEVLVHAPAPTDGGGGSSGGGGGGGGGGDPPNCWRDSLGHLHCKVPTAQ